MEKTETEVTTTETVENTENVAQTTETSEEKKEKTYTRAEVEHIKKLERDMIRAEFQKEAEAKRQEDERLAKMDEEQKKSYEIEQANKRALTAESELNAYKLKDEAIRQASEKGVDLDLMQTLDYTKETAESIKTKIDIFASASKKIHEKAISEYSKEPTPQTGDKINPDLNKTGYEKFAEKYSK